MAANLLNIMEDYQEIEIDEAKLRLICSKYNIWDHFGITRDNYVRLGEAEKLQMLKGFYKSKLPVYFGEGKLFVCCKIVCLLRTVEGNTVLITSLTLFTAAVLLTMKKFFLLTKDLY